MIFFPLIVRTNAAPFGTDTCGTVVGTDGECGAGVSIAGSSNTGNSGQSPDSRVADGSGATVLLDVGITISMISVSIVGSGVAVGAAVSIVCSASSEILSPSKNGNIRIAIARIARIMMCFFMGFPFIY